MFRVLLTEMHAVSHLNGSPESLSTNNYFSGLILENIGDLTFLVTLTLLWNDFLCLIPKAIASLTLLSTLDLSAQPS